MKITAVKEDITKIKTPALIVNLFEGVRSPSGATGSIDKALDGVISKLISEGEINGTLGETTVIHTFGKIEPDRVIVCGLGPQNDFTSDTVRQAVGETCRHLRKIKISNACTIAHGAGIGRLTPQESGQAIAEGAILGLYKFKRYLSSNDTAEFDKLIIVDNDSSKVPDIEKGIQYGLLMTSGTILARDMVNEPANTMTPSRMAEIASDLGNMGNLEVSILDRTEMETLGMGAFLGVAKGSTQPPKLISLKYNGDPENSSNVLGLIGKGVTFDSGGISLKSAGGMEEMKGDMAGGASVIGAMKILANLQPKVNVTGVVPATENMPGGEAQRPGDIVRALNGKTIEVINTDAEGRLILADAMVYATRLGITKMVDISTLTGAMVIALGKICTGIMGSDQQLINQVIKAGELSGERIWQLPMFPEYKDALKSSVADLQNVGGRAAGSITAGHFLAEFHENIPWAHLDIAGTSYSEKEKGYLVKGATGVPVRSLINLSLDQNC